MKLQNVNDMIKYVRCILEENVNSVPLEGVTDVGTISINKVIESVLAKSVESVAKIAPLDLFSMPKNEDFAMLSAYEGSGSVSVVYVKGDGSDGFLRNHVGAKIGTVTNITQTLTGKLYEGDEVITGYARRTDMDTPMYQLFGSNKNGGYVLKPDDFMRMLMIDNSSWERPILELTPLGHPYVSIARSQINISVGNEEKPLAVESFKNGYPAIELYPLEGGNNVTLVYVERPQITTVSGQKVINCDDGIYHAACYYAAYQVAMIKGYQNLEGYKQGALDSLTPPVKNVNATSGAEVER